MNKQNRQERRTPHPRIDFWVEKWKSLRASVRVRQIVERIWSELLTQEEREFVEKDDSIGPDIVDIWAKLRNISANQAIVDLGTKLNLIGDLDRQQLLKRIGEDVKSIGVTLPTWDRSLGELHWGAVLVKRIRRLKVATNAILILDAFQELRWPPHLDDPLRRKETLRQKASQRLQDAIKSLNRNLTLIRFRGDGKGTGVVWNRI